MDPLTGLSALGLAANIIQFIDFGGRLISGTVERYRSATGTSASNLQLELITKDLKSIVNGLETERTYPNASQPSKLDQTLIDLATESKERADELLAILDDLKAQGEHKRWDSFVQAVKSIDKEKRISKLQKNLNKMQKNLILCLVTMMSNRDSNALSALDKLSEQHRKLGINTADLIQSMKSGLIAALNESTSEIKTSAKETLSNLIKEGETSAAQQNILRSLKYPMMRARQSNIELAHRRTFDWIFQDASATPFPQVKFLEWLQSYDGIFWVAGKAGSGKSTLMKHLYQHDRTTEVLQIWAGKKKLVTASHFFWVGGGELQKSQDGLLCSLLDDILTQCPALIPAVAASRWESDYSHDPWTRNELFEAFAELKKQVKIPMKFCFFIDGLDEYEGDRSEIVEVLKDFATSPDIKICLSSRPWVVFESSLGKDPNRMLMLQDLTREDIRLYIRERLEEDPRYKEYKSVEKEEIVLKQERRRTRENYGGEDKDQEENMEQEEVYEQRIESETANERETKATEQEQDCDQEMSHYSEDDLIAEIVDMAKGVFLWVFLVVRDLLVGLTNKDTPEVLQMRLHSLPKNLKLYFMAMLNNVDEVYHEQTAQILQMSLSAREPLSLMTLSYLEESDPEYAIKAEIEYPSLMNIDRRCKITQTRVKARCSDLLEIIDDESQNLQGRYRAEFLHRTARDFLLTSDIQIILRKRLRKPFDVNLYLCRAFLAQMKLIPREPFYFKSLLMDIFDDFMLYASEREKNTGSMDWDLLDEVERVLISHQRIFSFLSTEGGYLGLGNEYHPGWVTTEAIQWGLCSYVAQRLRAQPELIKGIHRRPPLDFALKRNPRSRHMDPVEMMTVDPDMVRLLLELGASPNQEYDEVSVWARFLRAIWKNRAFLRSKDAVDAYTDVIEALLRAGADADLSVETDKTRTQAGIKGRIRYAVYTSAFEIISLVCSEKDVRRLRRIADDRRENGWLKWVASWSPWN